MGKFGYVSSLLLFDRSEGIYLNIVLIMLSSFLNSEILSLAVPVVQFMMHYLY